MTTSTSNQSSFSSFFKNFNSDFPASIVVFFVALPLCLGIALASGAPLFSGVIAGIVGGIVVGIASGSQLGVSGPAAGLAVIVLTAIGTLGSYEAFLFSVVVAGILQFLLGYFKAGFIAYFVPSSVIKGMLTGIGLLIILKQIPHALGYDFDYEGSESFFQKDGSNTFSALMDAWNLLTPGALFIAAISMAVLILWDTVLTKKHKVFQILQGPIVVVLLGILFNYLFQTGVLNFSLADNQIVDLPVANNLTAFFGQFTILISHNFQIWKSIKSV
jgi:MFS superfamily sulfate permease-like transporter